MKHKSIWASVLGLGVTLIAQVQTMAVTNGVIVISTRTATDAFWRQTSSSSLWDADDFRGPGVFSPGDTAMGILLQDHGYSTRLVPEFSLRWDQVDWFSAPNIPAYYYEGGGGPSRPNQNVAESNILCAASLVIISGSGSSADMPPPNTNGIPIIMGEHSCLGDAVLSGKSSIFMYGPKNSGNRTGTTPGTDQYMVVREPNHPIMQGIPLDVDGRVKIFRDPYPEENAHIPAVPSGGGSPGPKLNWKFSWTAVNLTSGTTVAPGTTILGVRAAATNDAVFAVMDIDGLLADTSGDPSHPWFGLATAQQRLVHFFVNEHGSGDARRAFNILTDIGRVIFVRTCKWAMGETLAPYVPLNINVSQLSPTSFKLQWNGSADKNYKILGSATVNNPLFNWETLKQDIPGVNGTMMKTLTTAGPQLAFFKVVSEP